MPDLKDVPDAVRWKFAAECAAKLPALYEIAFREVLGNKYDALEREIWMEVARMVREIVQICSLPVKTAPEIARSIQQATIILLALNMAGRSLNLLMMVLYYLLNAARSWFIVIHLPSITNIRFPVVWL